MERSVKWVAALATLAVIAGCAEPAPPPAPAPAPVAAKPVDPECKTVVVFSSTKITKPAKALPDGWKQFSGVWGKAGWDDNTWCHDLYVLKIEKTGKVEIMDAHGPGGKHDGSAFRRTAQLTAENKLEFIADGIKREYWIEDGKLRGRRFVAEDRTSEIAMTRKK